MRDAQEEERSFAARWLSTWSSRIAAIVLGLWITAALLAPFLANDRPYWMRAVDNGRHEAARTSLVTVTRAWLALETEGAEAWSARRGPAMKLTFADALALEERAVRSRLSTLQEQLAPGQGETVAALVACRDARGESRLVAAQQAQALLVLASPTTPDGVRLASSVSYPLLADVTGFEAALAVGWIVLGIALLITRSWRARLAAVAVVMLAVGCAWHPLFGSDRGPESLKAAVERGDLVVEDAVFPPIPFGHTETKMREAYCPPTWMRDVRAGDVQREGSFVPQVRGAEAAPFEPAIDSRWRHMLGTDSLGRDLCARILFGARVSLFVGNAAALILSLLGIVIGLWAGWRRGLVDFLVSRGIEVVLCFPAFVLVMCALFFVDPAAAPPLVAVALVIGIVGWTGVARLVRAETLRVRELDYVTAARAAGLGEGAILVRHVLPNSIQPAIIAFAFAVGAGILTESALSFLGFGVQIPVPSWGALVSDSKSAAHPWIWVVPGLAIFSVVASYNILGEALRDALDPRHER